MFNNINWNSWYDSLTLHYCIGGICQSMSHFGFNLELCDINSSTCLWWLFVDKLQRWTHLFHAKGQQIKWMTISTSNKGLADRQHVANILVCSLNWGTTSTECFPKKVYNKLEIFSKLGEKLKLESQFEKV